MIKKILTIISVILSYNLIFFLQDFFQSELQIYLLGFRLNLFLVINLILIYINREKLSTALPYIKNINIPKNWLLIFTLALIVSGVSLLILNQIGIVKYKKPDFIIEFALTALTDLPIYYLWNLPFLLSSLILIVILIDKFSFFRSFVFTILITISFLSLGLEGINDKIKLGALSYLLLIFGFILYNLGVTRLLKSVWVSIFSILTLIYSYVLIFGSKNSLVIKTFFAKTYTEWEGIFLIKKVNPETIDLIFSGLMILFAFFFFIFDRKKSN